MRRILSAAVLVAAFATGVGAQGNVEKTQMEMDALEAKGDKTAYARFLTDNFVWIGRSGRLEDRKTVIDELQPAKAVGKSVGIDVRPYPGGAIMVFTRLDGTGKEVAKVLRLWLQQGSRWQLAVHQGAPLDTPVAAASQPSSPLSANAGPAAEIKAVEEAIEALTAGNRKGDAKNFAASVTDAFVAINPSGDVASKQQRIEQISKGPNANATPTTVEQSSTRIFGDLAVTTRITRGATGRAVQTIVHAKQGGKWLRAGIITTPIVMGKPRS